MLIVIPARAGSSLPGKNMRPVNGVSLVDRALRLANDLDGHIVVTTDIPELLSRTGDKATIYHERPTELCTATALAWDVWRDAVKAAELRFSRTWEQHAYMEPTSPCRRKTDVLDCLNRDEDSVCTVSRTHHPFKAFSAKAGKLVVSVRPDGFLNNVPRQTYDGDWFVKNGICYTCSDQRMQSAQTMLDEETFLLEIERPVVNIDTERDFILADLLCRD